MGQALHRTFSRDQPRNGTGADTPSEGEGVTAGSADYDGRPPTLSENIGVDSGQLSDAEIHDVAVAAAMKLARSNRQCLEQGTERRRLRKRRFEIGGPCDCCKQFSPLVRQRVHFPEDSHLEIGGDDNIILD